jgi:Rieske Fe-S protein
MEDLRAKPDATTGPGTDVTAGALTRLGVSRRNVVLGASVVGAAGLLAACGGGSSDSTAGTGSGGSSTGAPDSSASTDDNGGGDGGGSGGSEKLASTSDVPVKGGTINKNAKVVVCQPASGTFKAFSAVCTHQSCLVASVDNNVITCPCHGSQFSATDGSVMGGPAPAPLSQVSVTVSGDDIVKA